jgi:hypothetical protein
LKYEKKSCTSPPSQILVRTPETHKRHKQCRQLSSTLTLKLIWSGVQAHGEWVQTQLLVTDHYAGVWCDVSSCANNRPDNRDWEDAMECNACVILQRRARPPLCFRRGAISDAYLKPSLHPKRYIYYFSRLQSFMSTPFLDDDLF